MSMRTLAALSSVVVTAGLLAVVPTSFASTASAASTGPAPAGVPRSSEDRERLLELAAQPDAVRGQPVSEHGGGRPRSALLR
jgi:hypothetical protein